MCSGAPIADPVPRRLVSANFENASRIRAFRSVRVFGHNAITGCHAHRLKDLASCGEQRVLSCAPRGPKPGP